MSGLRPGQPDRGVDGGSQTDGAEASLGGRRRAQENRLRNLWSVSLMMGGIFSEALALQFAVGILGILGTLVSVPVAVPVVLGIGGLLAIGYSTVRLYRGQRR